MHMRSPRQSLLLIALICVGLIPGQARAQDRQRFLLIDLDLRADTVELAAIEDGWVECLRSGLIDRRPMHDLLAIMRVDEPDPARFAAGDRLVDLVDGQRWVGAPASAPLPDHLGWKIDRIGVLAAPVEQIRRARFLPGAKLLKLDEHAAEDRLLLANGDALSGLLVSLGEEIVFEVTDSLEPTRLPRRHVASLALVNPAQRPSGMMVWLADGSVLRVRECRWSPASFQFTTMTDGLKCNVETEMLRGISFDSQRLMPLAELAPEVSRDSPYLRVVEEPHVVDRDRAAGLADVEMRGPIEARYALPPGATRFFTTAVVPRSAAQWADFDLTILVDDRIVFESRMDGTGRSRREIILTLRDASALTVRLEEGARGPVQDVLLLQRPMILFD